MKRKTKQSQLEVPRNLLVVRHCLLSPFSLLRVAYPSLPLSFGLNLLPPVRVFSSFNFVSLLCLSSGCLGRGLGLGAVDNVEIFRI